MTQKSTRDRQIINASHNYGRTLNKEATFNYKDMKCAFEEGAMWADEYPANVWHDASEEPKGYPILCQDKSRTVWIVDSLNDHFDGWAGCVEFWDISQWVYISDILPKQL